jgi:pimeloyl-ACP methyl ester carboxylesterase
MTGDLTYYNVEHDLTEAQASRIDTSRIPVYLLTGEYDQLAYEDGTARLARAIKGSHFEVVPGLGHFGPSENPEDFKAALLPLFEEIARLV